MLMNVIYLAHPSNVQLLDQQIRHLWITSNMVYGVGYCSYLLHCTGENKNRRINDDWSKFMSKGLYIYGLCLNTCFKDFFK